MMFLLLNDFKIIVPPSPVIITLFIAWPSSVRRRFASTENDVCVVVRMPTKKTNILFYLISSTRKRLPYSKVS